MTKEFRTKMIWGTDCFGSCARTEGHEVHIVLIPPGWMEADQTCFVFLFVLPVMFTSVFFKSIVSYGHSSDDKKSSH